MTFNNKTVSRQNLRAGNIAKKSMTSEGNTEWWPTTAVTTKLNEFPASKFQLYNKSKKFSMFPSASPREILRFSGIKISCFLSGPVIKCLLFARVDLKWFTMGNSTTGHMGMVRENECSLNINVTLENPPIRHLRRTASVLVRRPSQWPCLKGRRSRRQLWTSPCIIRRAEMINTWTTLVPRI